MLKGLFTSDFEIFFCLIPYLGTYVIKTRHVFRIFDFDIVWRKNEEITFYRLPVSFERLPVSFYRLPVSFERLPVSF